MARSLFWLLAAALVAIVLYAVLSEGGHKHHLAKPEAVVKVLAPAKGIYQGAFPGFCPSEDCVSRHRVLSFELLAGKPLAWAYFSDNWFAGIHFPKAKVEAIWSTGAVPFIRLMPRGSWAEGCRDKRYPLPDLASGRFDPQLSRYARALAATRIPVMIDFAPEMNGDWFPWSASCWGDARGAALYRQALVHLERLFEAQGANRVTWVLHLDAYGVKAPWNRFSAYYPGPRYVDWAGLSAYGEDTPGDGWHTLEQALAPWRELEAAVPKKPLALFEFGVVEDPPHSKSQWTRQAFALIASGRYPRLKAVSWWSSDFGNGPGHKPSLLRIDSDLAALLAYRQAVASPLYVGRPRLGR